MRASSRHGLRRCSGLRPGQADARRQAARLDDGVRPGAAACAAVLGEDLRDLRLDLECDGSRVAGLTDGTTDHDVVGAARNKVKRGLAVLRSFIGGLKVTINDVTYGLDIEPERGAPDNGDLEIDLPNVFVALGEAAENRNTALAILIDKISTLRIKNLLRSSWRCTRFSNNSFRLCSLERACQFCHASPGDPNGTPRRCLVSRTSTHFSDLEEGAGDPARHRRRLESGHFDNVRLPSCTHTLCKNGATSAGIWPHIHRSRFRLLKMPQRW